MLTDSVNGITEKWKRFLPINADLPLSSSLPRTQSFHTIFYKFITIHLHIIFTIFMILHNSLFNLYPSTPLHLHSIIITLQLQALDSLSIFRTTTQLLQFSNFHHSSIPFNLF